MGFIWKNNFDSHDTLLFGTTQVFVAKFRLKVILLIIWKIQNLKNLKSNADNIYQKMPYFLNSRNIHKAYIIDTIGQPETLFENYSQKAKCIWKWLEITTEISS